MSIIAEILSLYSVEDLIAGSRLLGHDRETVIAYLKIEKFLPYGEYHG